MSERVRNLVTVTALVAMTTILATLVATSPSDVDRVSEIGERIKCPVCQGESIANSPSPMARDMMALVAERVANGQSDEVIVAELLAAYSGAVLLDPPASGATLILWLSPLAALGIGAVIIFWWRGHPARGVTGDPPEEAGPTTRRLVPLLILAAAFATIVVVAGLSLQDRSGRASGVAALGDQDLSDVSNDTMEAVIAANGDHPEVDGMRLALADRYFEEGDYRSAFPQYLAVADSANATDGQAVTALARLGWMAWDGNAEVETALNLFDQALAIDPSAMTAQYLKGQVLWCGAGDHEQAGAVFATVLSDPDLDAESRAAVQSDLDAVTAGEDCA